MEFGAHFKIFFSGLPFQQLKKFPGLGRQHVNLYCISSRRNLATIDFKVVVTRQGRCCSPIPHLQVVQHGSAHGLCVLVLLIYSLFPGKSSVVCRSCSSDIVYFYLWPLKPCPYTHFMHLPLPALPQSKVELQHTPGNCTKNLLILFYCSASFLLLSHQVSLEPLQLPFSKLLSLLKSLLKNIFHF